MTLKRIFVFLGNCLLIFCLLVMVFVIEYNEDWRNKVQDFDKYQNDFQTVADFAKDYYENGRKFGDLKVYWDREKECPYLESTWKGDYIGEIPDDVAESINVIYNEAFSNEDSKWDAIYYDEDRITFATWI